MNSRFLWLLLVTCAFCGCERKPPNVINEAYLGRWLIDVDATISSLQKNSKDSNHSGIRSMCEEHMVGDWIEISQDRITGRHLGGAVDYEFTVIEQGGRFVVASYQGVGGTSKRLLLLEGLDKGVLRVVTGVMQTEVYTKGK